MENLDYTMVSIGGCLQNANITHLSFHGSTIARIACVCFKIALVCLNHIKYSLSGLY
jgi:hypothetical protein